MISYEKPLVKAASLTYGGQYDALILNERLEYAMQNAPADWEYDRREIHTFLQTQIIIMKHSYQKRTLQKIHFPFLEKGLVSPSIKPVSSVQSKVTVYINK